MNEKFLNLCLIIFITSCGYQFHGSGSILPEDVKNVYIARSINNTLDPGLGTRLTQELESLFGRYQVVKIVDEKSKADAILKTKIISTATSMISSTGRTDVELQSNFTIRISAELNRINGQSLWKNSNIELSKSIGNTGNSVITTSSEFTQSGISASDFNSLNSREILRSQRQEASKILLKDAARRIYLNAVAETW